MSEMPIELTLVAEQVKSGETAKTKVRSLLSWFGFFRRSWRNVQTIREALVSVGLVTSPDFEGEYIDGEISFLTPPRVAQGGGSISLEGTGSGTVSGTSTVDAVGATLQGHDSGTGVDAGTVIKIAAGSSVSGHLAAPSSTDPTHRIGRLPSANNRPTSINPDAAVSEAVTLMLLHDFSQLPVMSGEREAKGLISWRSIGSRLALARPAVRVRDCMEDCLVVDSSKTLFEVVPDIVRFGCVLVRDGQRKISGIVTSSDISELYEQLSGPFLYLSEIENTIRHMISPHLDHNDLQSARDPSEPDREIRSVADLSFGGYVRLLQNPTIWEKVKLGIDRRQFTDRLDAVRVIRNDVMHFDPEGIDAEQVRTLNEFTSFLRRLRQLHTSPVASEPK